MPCFRKVRCSSRCVIPAETEGDLAVWRLHNGVDGLHAPLRRQAVQEDGLRTRLLHHRVVDLEVAEHLRGS